MINLRKYSEKVEKKDMPGWMDPMLATLTHDHFNDENWLYERKWDGERALVYSRKNKVKIYSRNQKIINNTYPEIAEKFEKTELNNFIADGEICAFDGNLSSFSLLQNRMQLKSRKEAKNSSIKVYLYLFDLLYLDNFLLTRIPLRIRKKILKKEFSFNDPIRFTPHRNKEGKEFFKEACRKGWEGLIAKDAEAEYINDRSKKWLKFKCVNRQEFVIGGFTNPEGERKGFGSLLIGYYKSGELKYAGKVGTGFNDKLLHDLGNSMKKIIIDQTPFKKENIKVKNLNWIKPELVCEVEFTEWTDDGRLRHPAFKGLRRDKNPEKVKKEG